MDQVGGAQGGASWVVSSKGYSGAHMHQIVVVPGDAGHVYTSARSGLFSSQDGGDSWQGLAYGISRQLEAQAIAVDPVDSQHILATFEDLRPDILVSRTGGRSWKSIIPGLWSGRVMATRIVFAPNAPQRVYASVGAMPCLTKVLPEHCANSIGKGVVISVDGGETWEQSGLSSGTVMDLIVLPGDG